jgi:hypothetical protein
MGNIPISFKLPLKNTWKLWNETPEGAAVKGSSAYLAA